MLLLKGKSGAALISSVTNTSSTAINKSTMYLQEHVQGGIDLLMYLTLLDNSTPLAS